MVGLLKKEVSMQFDEVVTNIENVIKEEGLSILITKSIDEILKKKLGIKDYPRYTIILACSPELAKMSLDVSKDVGNLFPCSFVVYEDDDKLIVSHMSIMKAAVETGLALAQEMDPVIKKTEELVHRIWARIEGSDL
jgi:uncharacterized protein (DUF302 family)